MNKLIDLMADAQDFLLEKLKIIDFSAPLLLRLYLVPIFWMAGTKKWASMDSTIAWFGNSEWGLGLPMPEFLAYLATLTEIFGAVFLLLGIAVRWISIPLMFTMIVAAVSVHWKNGCSPLLKDLVFLQQIAPLGQLTDLIEQKAFYRTTRITAG